MKKVVDICDTFPFETLKSDIKGEFADSAIYRRLYATDASAYREIPVAVVWPKDKEDIQVIIDFCRKHKLPVIPRGAGTSLAGQVVGNGLVVDISRHMKSIIEYRPEEKWIKVEPGVVRDELNKITSSDKLFFGPETSTSNRANIGGMVGNNSCGAHSLVYGSTREHCLEIDAILGDGSEVTFKPLTPDEFNSKCNQQDKEGEIYRQLYAVLSDQKVQQEMHAQLPDPAIKRRNTGYAIDILYNTSVFEKSNKKINLSSLICGSEGTLAFITAVKLNLEPLPPAQNALVCVHTNSLDEAFRANLIALKYKPSSIELMDDQILELSKLNREQEKNRFFVEGSPKAILIVEFARDTMEEIKSLSGKMEQEMRQQGLGYSFPVIKGDDTQRVWDLRKAGLGILYNMPGDTKPVPVIEDTAVNPEVLPDYMADFRKLIDKHQLKCVYYAHI
ncbi:MAG: FAD-binding oxidoreductase, partial [Bacteroidales bacterium]